MSVLSAVKGFFTVSSTDLDASIKAVYAKADADVAALKKSAASNAASKAYSDSVARVHAVYQEHLNLLQKVGVTGTTGATGPTGAV